MPTYVYRCPFCLEEQEAFKTIAERNDAPECHNRKMERVIKPTMVSVFNPYRAVAVDKETGKRPLIRSKSEHEAFLRRNGYEEVGNDKSMAPPTKEQAEATKKEKLKEESFVFNDINHEATL